MKTECPNPRPDCKYYERGCFADTDHIVPRRLGKCSLSKMYINLPENKQQLCRAEHDEKCRRGDEPLPDRETMRKAIIKAERMGKFVLSKNDRRAVHEAASQNLMGSD